jgi:hypothetical protein
MSQTRTHHDFEGCREYGTIKYSLSYEDYRGEEVKKPFLKAIFIQDGLEVSFLFSESDLINQIDIYKELLGDKSAT